MISRSLNGGKIVWIAREGGKVIARADTPENLDIILEERAANMRTPLPIEVIKDEEDENGPETKRSSSSLRPRKSAKKPR